MPDTPSITLVKEFQYRDKPEKWSNTYHFSGTTPSSVAEWQTLGEAIWSAEKTMFKSAVKLVGLYGYEAGNELSVAQIDYSVPPLAPIPGTSSVSASPAPGDVAFWVRWRTPDRNSRGKWIYLRKYFHGVLTEPGLDTVAAPVRTAAAAYAAKMIDGTLPGGAKICGPQGAVASAPLVSTYATTRTLKRRGKRPSS